MSLKHAQHAQKSDMHKSGFSYRSSEKVVPEARLESKIEIQDARLNLKKSAK